MSLNLNTLGKNYEIRGNGAIGSKWSEKPLYGWVTHLPPGWTFTPAPGMPRISAGRFYADFEAALPPWTGGLIGTWSEQVGEGCNLLRKC